MAQQADLAGSAPPSPGTEWLEADGAGGFAMGTAAGWRTRRYHGLLCVSLRPPTHRVMLVNAVEAWVDLGSGPVALSSHRYLPAVTHPDGSERLVAFSHEPFPTWTYQVADGVRVVHELFVPRIGAVGDPGSVILRWRLQGAPTRARLTLRPLLSVRDLHALRHQSTELDLRSRLQAREGGDVVCWQPDRSQPTVRAASNGRFHDESIWYRDFLYEEDRARGHDHVEDLASPGFFEYDLRAAPACLVLGARRLPAAGAAASTAASAAKGEARANEAAADTVQRRFDDERARRRAQSLPDRAAEAYLVHRGTGRSIIAGYPWFTDWGRDTFLSLRGLLLARGKADEAAEILRAWAEHVQEGMLPNRFPDDGPAEFNSVDASLWFVVAVAETLAATRDLSAARRGVLEAAARAILDGYTAGTRFGIRADADGLLACGEPGSQLTWMDAKVGDEVMTPRIGKPVEIQALWIHALSFGAQLDPAHGALAERARAAFEPRFWNEEAGCLHDVVDCDHVPGTVDSSLRPNQVLAVGGLPTPLVSAPRARRIVDVLERALWTPLGLRTLAPTDPQYRGRYAGGPLERDRAYHQGTAWPWLLGPFVEAWLRVRGDTESARRTARERFLAPLSLHLRTAGLGHLSEVADGDAPHRPGGCPFQAWSLAEWLRLERVVLARRPTSPPAPESPR